MVWKGWVSDVRRYIITLWELRINTTVYRVLFSSLLVINLFKLPLIRRVYSFIYLFICSCICLFFFIYLIIYLFIFNPFIVHSFTYNFIYLFICLWSLFSFHFQMFIYIYISIKGFLASTDERKNKASGGIAGRKMAFTQTLSKSYRGFRSLYVPLHRQRPWHKFKSNLNQVTLTRHWCYLEESAALVRVLSASVSFSSKIYLWTTK